MAWIQVRLLHCTRAHMSSRYSANLAPINMCDRKFVSLRYSFSRLCAHLESESSDIIRSNDLSTVRYMPVGGMNRRPRRCFDLVLRLLM